MEGKVLRWKLLWKSRIASAFTFFGRRNANFSARLGLASGLLSLAFGLLLVYQIGFASGLFSGHPRWTPH